MILSIVINKLGDRSKVLASSVIHKLRMIGKWRSTQYVINILFYVADKNYSLVMSIVEEVRAFLFRPHLGERAKYYAIVLLSCLKLKKESSVVGQNRYKLSNLALTLAKVYTSFFYTIVNAPSVPERLTAVLLSGLSRATPFITGMSRGTVLVYSITCEPNNV